MKRVLLYVHYPSHVPVMRRIAGMLKDTGRFDPVLYFDTLEVAYRCAPACASIGLRTDPKIRPGEVEPDTTPRALTGPVGPWLWDRVLDVGRMLPDNARIFAGDAFATAVAPASFSWSLLRYLSGLAKARTLLDRHQACAIALPGDSISYETPSLIRAAHERKAPAVIVPFTVSGPSEVAVDLSRHREFGIERPLNRLLATTLPHWRYDHGDKPLVRSPAAQAAAFEILGLAPPDPWTLHSGFADRIAVESDYMLDHYQRHRFPDSQLVMCGAITDDLAAVAMRGGTGFRDRIVEEVGLPIGARLAVFTMSDFTGFFKASKAEGFSSRDDLVRFWLDVFQEMTGWNVLISLHPFIREDQYPSLVRTNVRVSKRPIEELIGASELFISSISATVRTAIACGVPVVDHDPFAFRYPNFVGLPGIRIVEGRVAFRDALLGIALDRDTYETAAREQRKIAGRFGHLDGEASKRMVALFDSLIAEQGGSS